MIREDVLVDQTKRNFFKPEHPPMSSLCDFSCHWEFEAWKNNRRKLGCLNEKPQLKIYLKIPWNTETEINNIINNNTEAKIINLICHMSYVTFLQPMLLKIRGFRNSCRLNSVDCKNKFIFLHYCYKCSILNRLVGLSYLWFIISKMRRWRLLCVG